MKSSPALSQTSEGEEREDEVGEEKRKKDRNIQSKKEKQHRADDLSL